MDLIVKVCQNCGGMNLAEETECTHCGASLTGGCPTDEYCGADYGEFPPDSPHESDACDMCDGHHHCDECPHLTDGDDDDGEEEAPRDWIVTMSRTKSVQQTAEVHVKAHSEEEAMDLIEDRAERESERWRWEDNDDTEEFDDVGAVEAEEVA